MDSVIREFFYIRNLIILLLKILQWLSASFKITSKYTVFHKLAPDRLYFHSDCYSSESQFKTCYSPKPSKPWNPPSPDPHVAF